MSQHDAPREGEGEGEGEGDDGVEVEVEVPVEGVALRRARLRSCPHPAGPPNVGGRIVREESPALPSTATQSGLTSLAASITVSN